MPLIACWRGREEVKGHENAVIFLHSRGLSGCDVLVTGWNFDDRSLWAMLAVVVFASHTLARRASCRYTMTFVEHHISSRPPMWTPLNHTAPTMDSRSVV